jgi:hypothetical protein
MNIDRLYQILNETTMQLRKGEEVETRAQAKASRRETRKGKVT